MNRLLSRVKLAYQIAVIGAIGIIGLVAIGIVYLQASATQAAVKNVSGQPTSAGHT